jgi:putative membrane protein
MWWDGPWHAFPWFWVFPLIFLLIVLFVFWRGLPMCGGHHRALREESARELLDRRYVRGEITADEYRRMRKDLEAGST